MNSPPLVRERQLVVDKSTKNQSISPLSRLSWPTFPPSPQKSESCSTLMDSVSTTVSIDQLLNKLDFKGFHLAKMNYCR
jgi:hypothetical protein